MITVFTVILGGYDYLRPPAFVEPGVRYVCFSDEPMRCEPWEIQPAPRLLAECHRNSRIPKILPHLLLPGAEYSIYHDGCFSMGIATKPSDLIAETLNGCDIAMYRHPCRVSVAQEVDICEREGIGELALMRAQAGRYWSHGLREGLWAGGVIIRRHTDLVTLLNEVWWEEYMAGSSRDQISFPFARLAVGLKIHTIDDDILQDHAGRFQFHFHAWAVGNDNEQYAEERARQANRLMKLKALCEALIVPAA